MTAPKRDKAHAGRVDDERPDSVHGDDEIAPWTPPTNLQAPPANPGMGQRWIRTSLGGIEDPVNFGRAMQEGWKPRKADSVPAGYHPPKISQGEYAGCIGVQGLILCEMPLTRIRQRARHYAKVGELQMRAVDEDIQRVNANNTVPGFSPVMAERSSRVTRGRRPAVADEDD